MGKRFDQLTLEERCRLRGLLEMGLNKSDIARRLGRHRSTIGRELVRNGLKSGYAPDRAHHMAWVRRIRGSKIERRSRLWRYVEDRLAMGWSPEQIAGRLRRLRSRYAISHETIYRFVYSRPGRISRLHRYLPQAKGRRGRRARKGSKQPNIPNRTPIWMRPTKAHLRAELGHWEGDLMHFRRARDQLLTLVERKTRLTLAVPLPSKTAKTTAAAITETLKGLPKRARQTITYDNGGEFAGHEHVEKEIGLRAFFCDPHSPWQRGSIENANGRLRRDLPRKACLNDYTLDDINHIVWTYNLTPRKCLDYATPIEAFAQQIGVALEM